MKTSSMIAGLMVCLSPVCACDGPVELLGIERSWFEATHGIIQEDPYLSDQECPAVISCIVRYPEDYDWRRDTLYGGVECELLIYRDSTLLRRFPAGKGHRISPEADTHFLFGEDLYTVWKGEGKVVIKRNGRDLAEYLSSEVIRGIMPFDGALWTLGTDHNGLYLRKDGTIMFEKRGADVADSAGDNGTDISGALYMDCSQLCFSYSKDGVWHTVCGGEDSVVDSGGAIDDIMKVRRINGTLHILGDRNGAPGPYIYDGKSTRKFLYYTLDPQSDQRLFVQDGEPFYAGCIHNPSSGVVTTEVWNVTKRMFSVTSNLCYVYRAEDGQGYYVALSCTGAAYSQPVSECVYINVPGHEPAMFDTGHYFSGSRGAAYLDGTLAVGLTPMDGHPFVWKNGEIRSFPVHGYVSTVGFDSD